MEEQLHIHYDKEGDFLELQLGKPRPGYFKEIGEGIFERRDETTDHVVGIAIVGFVQRSDTLKDLNISLPLA